MKLKLKNVYLLMLFFSCKQIDEDKFVLRERFLKENDISKVDTLSIALNYDTLDKIKKLNSEYYKFLDTTFLKNTEPNQLHIWKVIEMKGMYPLILLTNSSIDGSLESYLFSFNSKGDKLQLIDVPARFYQLHNTSIIETSYLFNSNNMLYLKKAYEYCDFKSNPKNGTCYYSVTINVYKNHKLTNLLSKRQE